MQQIQFTNRVSKAEYRNRKNRAQIKETEDFA